MKYFTKGVTLLKHCITEFMKQVLPFINSILLHLVEVVFLKFTYLAIITCSALNPKKNSPSTSVLNREHCLLFNFIAPMVFLPTKISSLIIIIF